MTTLNKQGVLMDKWFKTPNAIVDDITGDIVSTQAAAILNTILRLTEGVRGREWASIPHSLFMRKTRATRRETIAKYIKELTDNGLIEVKKSNGKVTEYCVNWKSSLWYSIPVVEVKAVSSVPVRFIRTGTFHPYTPVRFIRTGELKTSTFHPYTYKDIKTKDNTKDKKKVIEVTKKLKPSAKTLNIPFDDFWNLYDYKSTNKKTAETRWSRLKNDERAAVINHLPAYIQSTPDKNFRKHPSSYLNQEHWKTPIDQSNQASVKKIERATDPLAINAKWIDNAPMSDEERREWAGVPVPYSSGDQEILSFDNNQGVMQI